MILQLFSYLSNKSIVPIIKTGRLGEAKKLRDGARQRPSSKQVFAGGLGDRPASRFPFHGNDQQKHPRQARALLLVTPAGFEPAIFWMRTRYPGPLDEGAISYF